MHIEIVDQSNDAVANLLFLLLAGNTGQHREFLADLFEENENSHIAMAALAGEFNGGGQVGEPRHTSAWF